MKIYKIILAIVTIAELSFAGFFGWKMWHANKPVYIYSLEVPEPILLKADNKPLCVFVWSIGCSSCFEVFRFILVFKEEFERRGGKFMFVLIDDNVIYASGAKALFMRAGLNYECFYDKTGDLKNRFNITSVPILLFFDKKSKLAYTTQNCVQLGEDKQLEKVLNKILPKK